MDDFKVSGPVKAEQRPNWGRRILQEVGHTVVMVFNHAPKCAFYLIVAWALVDYDGLRDLLITASAEDIQALLLTFVATCMLMSLLGAVLTTRSTGPIGTAVLRAGASSTNGPGNGDSILSQPTAQSRAVGELGQAFRPNRDQRRALNDLLSELARPINANGSDLLDAKVRKVLGVNTPRLKPTQCADDARVLLSSRFGGFASVYQWDVQITPADTGVLAALTVRPRPVNPNIEGGPWSTAPAEYGLTEAMAITTALMRRETWSMPPLLDTFAQVKGPSEL